MVLQCSIRHSWIIFDICGEFTLDLFSSSFSLALPIVIYVVAYRKIRVTHEGLYYSQIVNPFKPLFIPWNNITRISTSFGYHIVTSEGVTVASFTDRIEKFDRLLESFHSKKISIDKKNLQVPQPDPALEDSGFLTSSSNPPRLYQHNGLILGLLVIALLGALELSFFILCFVVFGPVNAILSVVWLIMTLWFLDLVLNGFVRIRLEGLDIPLMFGRRQIILWTEIPYAKYFESTIGSKTFRVLKLFANNKDDFLGSVVQDSPAWEPLLRELKSLSIPIIEETELFNAR
eukprot:CAMPEP_0168570210 /NCGR_PEP_ID=MMETSP0413-20121227/16594_1 /TAXON_ID=136452 /ORGANISM="Filamoeba nolandi, Strain NC-AS-23-1" /LENGTH=288 /DNA_ID=CAMNT_0008602807 /DNA_START=1 /DNA_END=863 /DNA_ORIENTATION=-